MAGRMTNRKGKAKDTQSNVDPIEFAPFTMPDSLPADPVPDYPMLITRKVTANWESILEESRQFHEEIEEYVQSKREPHVKSQFTNTETDYIKKEVFVTLIPAIEETLNKAKTWDVFYRQKCFFNGIDWIVQYLWNNNPRHPHRAHNPQHLYNMPWVKKLLQRVPRPYFPKSWLWTETYAATMIQKTVRQYFVQREEDVQEMRDFWKKVKMERNIPEIDMNPLLARKFASSRSLRVKK